GNNALGQFSTYGIDVSLPAVDNGIFYVADVAYPSDLGIAQRLTVHAHRAIYGPPLFETRFPTVSQPLAEPQSAMTLRAGGGVVYIIAPVTPATSGVSTRSDVLALSGNDGSLRWEHALDGVPYGATVYLAP
ncbi:MAG TPA: hypothetical protein VGR57_18930, partial [Ktedonobacterales bacterium]|nr:hypothetical protein [Ktedonobacterales bacterium]